ncbi:hypothetical protein INT47_003008 [Mucor saturninus]|uniref:F-box domain-containing protein n=1 Tax=Mucor saturninus TaxID=64648 RepID=A0A8H7QU28_9FUNG|nr:hypothetical protein INT47_003008 [Mucor saturninus]
MIQQLPLEIVTAIANYIPLKDTGEFARTCRKCYFAVLPHIWHDLTITDTKDLSIVAKKLQTNSLWAQRAVQFVRDVSFSSKNNKQFSSTLAATLFGTTSTHTEQEDEKNEFESVQPHERFVAFGRRILELFPHLTSLLVDFSEAARNFYSTEETITRLPFTGSFSLINYRADQTRFMHNLISPFRKIRHLKVQGLQVVSLCDDIDESILTNNDIGELATLGLMDLERLELSYLDLDIELNTMQRLMQSLPHLQHLELEWIFPPAKQDYLVLCSMMKTFSLYPECLQKKNNILFVRFSHS